MGKLVIVAILLGVAYWYWSGSHEPSTGDPEADRLQENAEIMQRCMNHERRMQSAGGMAGVADVGSSGEDAETLCANEYHLEKRDGQWYPERE